MEINIGEIIVDEEIEIGGLELDVVKVGGPGGIQDYEELNNLPSINGVELIGNKTTRELGIVTGKEVHVGENEPTDEDVVIWIDLTEEADKIPTKTSELENDSKFVDETYVNNILGDIETALDNVISTQESYIGGATE